MDEPEVVTEPEAAPAPAPKPTIIKALGGGVSLVAPKGAIVAKPVLAKPGVSVYSATQTVVKAGAIIAPVIKRLQIKKALKVTIMIAGKAVALASLVTDAKGTVTLPAFKIAKPGVYFIQLASASGAKFFVKVVVTK
jgi:hypothetical protein